MNQKKYPLTLYAVTVVCLMYVTFIVFSFGNNKSIRYFGPYTIYLLLIFIGSKSFNKRSERMEVKRNYVYYALAFLPVVATFFGVFLPEAIDIGPGFYVISILYGACNGIIEEMFWRKTFNRVYGNDLVFSYIIPTVLFTCWHGSLLFCKGMEFTGGGLALVGGAGFMGILWGFVMYRTKNVRITMIAHVLVNICTFSPMIFDNFGLR